MVIKKAKIHYLHLQAIKQEKLLLKVMDKQLYNLNFEINEIKI